VSGFWEKINYYYYYIIYPPRLMEVYCIWREDVRLDNPPDPVVTCLLLRVCACAAQYLHPDSQERIQAELSIPARRLTDVCNQAAVELSGKIPAGEGGLLQVQQLFLTAYWNICEARYVDCWHALGAAIREAQEIGSHPSCPSSAHLPPVVDMLTINAAIVGLNRESTADDLGDFDREMGRRVWCILDSWDW
jgi:hypothetical protein